MDKTLKPTNITGVKAGPKKQKATRGPHLTSPEDRARGRWLSKFGFKFYRNPYAGK